MRTVIGLEVHAQLLTKTKLFCSCSANYYGTDPNVHTCPVCLGMPGALPVLNEEAVEYALKAALALKCQIPRRSTFARKSYFYPDLPKGYQISQFDEPLAVNGSLDLPKGKHIRIRRVHLEEDAGKSLHMRDGPSLVDLNRAGVPLIEIVSEPEISSPEDARLYMEELRRILRYIGVCSGDMDKGSLRCDANISINSDGQLGTKTEIKNMNSFRAVEEALHYEIESQKDTLSRGGAVEQSTLYWNVETGKTGLMRTKEESEDYRYLPDPDLVPLEISDEWKARIVALLPELPAVKRARWQREYGLPEYDVRLLTEEPAIADYFESVTRHYHRPRDVSNWIRSEVFRLLRETQSDEIKIAPKDLALVLQMVEAGQINRYTGKEVIEEAFRTANCPEVIIKEKGLARISDEGALAQTIAHVLTANAKAVSDFRSGKEAVVGFLQGQVMKATGGKADPKKTRELLIQQLKTL